MLSAKVPYYILDLLQQVPNVFVRGLGRFDAIFHPAVLDLPQSQIKPPYIEPDFSNEESSNGQILASYIHYTSGIDLALAEEAINDFVQLVQDQTQGGNSYAIEKFGIFTRNSLGNIRFTPDWDAFNLSFSGLEVLDLKPIGEHTSPDSSYIFSTPIQAVPEPIPESSKRTTEEIHQEIDKVKESFSKELQEEIIKVKDDIDESTSRLWWVILSCALFLITVLCAYLAWDIISNRQKLKSLNQIKSDTTATQPDIVTSPVDTTTFNTNEPPAITPQEKKDSIVEPKTPTDAASSCFIVVGAFANASNVSRMEERLHDLGYTTELIKGGSLTRVAIRSSCDPDSVQKILNEARSTINPEAWIY